MPTRFAVKTPQQVHDDYIRVVKNGLIQRGITAAQLNPGSDEDLRAWGFANEVAALYSNQVILGDQQMPDTATGTNLYRIGSMFGLSPRSASGSAGNTTLTSSASTFISSGQQLVDAVGLRFQVSIGGTYANGASVPVQAIDTGVATNHVAGDVLRWVSPPPYASQTISVATGGLTGGIDPEDDETFRGRLLGYLQNPPKGGNAAMVSLIAQQSSSAVAMGGVYPAVNGPSTVHVATPGFISRNSAGQVTSMSRVIAASTMTSTITPYIQGNLAEYAEVTVTATTDQNLDVAVGLTLPSATTASPPGPGGGWIDGTPWPSFPGAVAAQPVTVTAFTSTTNITVNATTAPTANVTHIAFLDPTTWLINTAIVTGVTVLMSGSSYQITLDTPWPNIGVNNVIWPQANNQQAYVNALLLAFSLMGPGEKTSNSNILGRAARKPPPLQSFPYTFNTTQLTYIQRGTPVATGGIAALPANPEVTNVSVLYTSGTPTLAPVPTVPGSVTSPPNIFVPRNIGFYPA